MKIKITPTDESKVSNGIWVNYRGVELLIAKWKNEYLIQATNKVFGRKRNVDANDERVQVELIKIMAVKVLKGWKPFKVEDHQIEYNFENAVNLLTHDPDCRDFVSDVSRDIDLYLIEKKEDIVGK